MAKALSHILRDPELLRVLVILGSSLVTVGLLSLIGKISLAAFLALFGGWLGFGRTEENSKGLIEAGKYKIAWVGVGVGMLLAGILIILSVIVSLFYGHPA
jgi:hypothetical protein